MEMTNNHERRLQYALYSFYRRIARIASGKNVVIKLRKRRYRLTDERSFTSVAREVNLSVSTVIRIFDLVSYPKAELPQVLSIDEFKGNTWEKNTNVY